MSFFLTDEQEDVLNLFLDEQNKKVCEDQLNSGDLPDDLAEIVRKTVEAESPIPAHDPSVGYYTVSFTPCDVGNRIYAHHHLSNVSVAISDPLRELEVEVDNEVEGFDVTLEEPENESINIVDDSFDPVNINRNGPPENMDMSDIVQHFGAPPQELLDKMGVKDVENLIQLEKETQENQ